MAAMPQLSVAALAAIALVMSSCTPDQKRSVPQDQAADAGAGTYKAPVAQATKCKLEPELAGPLRRAGTADIELSGSGGELRVKGAPALCGPMYDRDSDVLQVKAGEGLLFEVCLSEGLVSITSLKRVAGPQPIRSLEHPDGAEASFQRFKGATFSTRGDVPDDAITFGADFWSATAKVHLKSESDLEELGGTISFACPIPNPAAASAQNP
jgi:hypothetical protein